MNQKLTLNYVGSFSSTNTSSSEYTEYKLEDLSPGFNFFEKHIISVSNENNVEWAISRMCDHANGTLEPCNENNFAQCPLHGWKLDLEKLHYDNVNVAKKTLDISINNSVLIVNEPESHLQLPDPLMSQQECDDLNIRFLAHASLLFNCGDINIITDPWLKGPCFLNGWWHKPAPCEDALEQLLQADLVYISHNHPDHMHEESLQYLHKHRPDIPIVVPNFDSQSTEIPLKNIGFSNIIPLPFNQIFQINQEKIYICILKSGDFRDDSGLYVSYGQKQALITVDSSSLNHYHLPKNIDFLATSFAAGASGHPWCFDHYDHQRKLQITSNRHKSVKLSILRYIQACQPRAYMPYAGYFSEDALRDKYIKNNNNKNTVADIEQLIEKKYPDIQTINPTITDHVIINTDKVSATKYASRNSEISTKEINHYLSNEIIPDATELVEKLTHYFNNSNFSDNLILYLIPCDPDFNYLETGIIVNFSTAQSIEKITSSEVEKHYFNQETALKQILVKVRANPLWEVIMKLKSWEELSIGFHCRIHRKPDVYNSDFWYHFSNIYIK